MSYRAVSTLDVENDLVRVFGILLQVSLNQDKTIVVGCSVEFTSVPRIVWQDESQRSFSHAT